MIRPLGNASEEARGKSVGSDGVCDPTGNLIGEVPFLLEERNQDLLDGKGFATERVYVGSSDAFEMEDSFFVELLKNQTNLGGTYVDFPRNGSTTLWLGVKNETSQNLDLGRRREDRIQETSQPHMISSTAICLEYHPFIVAHEDSLSEKQGLWT